MLFSANQTTAADGTPLPTAAVALSMDDETQYRCAGYIQAEIERYTELIGDSDDEDKENATSADDSDSEAPKTKKARKPAKAKKHDKKGMVLFSQVFVCSHYFVSPSQGGFSCAARTGVRIH